MRALADQGLAAHAALRAPSPWKQPVSRGSLRFAAEQVSLAALGQAVVAYVFGHVTFGGVCAGIGLVGGAAVLHRRRRTKRLAASTVERAAATYEGTVRADDVGPAPLSGEGCVAWAIELRDAVGYTHESALFRTVMTRGFRVELDGGAPPVLVAPGRIEMTGDAVRYRARACGSLLDWLFPGRTWEPDELGIGVAYQVTLRPGDRVRVRADVRHEPDPSAEDGHYRQSAAALARPIGTPHIELLERSPATAALGA